MFNRLLAPKGKIPEPGDVIAETPKDRLVVTNAQAKRDQAVSRAKVKGLGGPGFRVVQLGGTLFTARRYVGVRTIESLEELALLKIFDGRIAVRFSGEYRTLEMDRTRFEQKSDRHLIRNKTDRVAGIYHARDRRYLTRPKNEPLRGNEFTPKEGSGTPRKPESG